MKRHRFFCEYQINGEDISVSDSAVVHQATRVLRLTNGEEISLCSGDGREVRMLIEFFDRSILKGRIKETVTLPPDAIRELTLCMAITKKDTFEMIVQKATELGVTRIIPVLTARTIKKDVRLDRLYDIAREAAELSGRGTLPVIDEPTSLADALLETATSERWFGTTINYSHREAALTDEPVALFIGPEGGFTDEEVALFDSQHVRPFSLTHLILRSETAAIAAVMRFLV